MKKFAKKSLQQLVDFKISPKQQLLLKGGDDSSDDIGITDLIVG